MKDQRPIRPNEFIPPDEVEELRLRQIDGEVLEFLKLKNRVFTSGCWTISISRIVLLLLIVLPVFLHLGSLGRLIVGFIFASYTGLEWLLFSRIYYFANYVAEINQ